MRVLVVEDEPNLQRQLRGALEGAGYAVDAAADGEDGHYLGSTENYDAVILDLGLPEIDGLTVLDRWRKEGRTTPVLVLTARASVAERVLGLRSGADDYLVKPFSVDELDARVEVLARRGDLARGAVMQYGGITWLGDQGLVLVHGQRLDLSPREFEVLGQLLRRAPKLVPKRVLIDALAERNEEVGDSAAELYVSRLRRKLAGSGTAIQTQRGFGYMLVLEPVAV